MNDNFQTEDTLNNKEVEGSAAENLKCMGYFAQPDIFTKKIPKNVVKFLGCAK